MKSKKPKKTIQRKKKIPPTVSSPVVLEPQRFTLSDLDPDMRRQLTIDGDNTQKLLSKLANSPTEELSPEDINQINNQLSDLQNTLRLFDTDEKLKDLWHLNTPMTTYFKTTYNYKIASLFYFIGMDKEAINRTKQTFGYCNHPTIINQYYFLKTYYPKSIDEASDFYYRLKIFLNTLSVLGTERESYTFKELNLDTIFIAVFKKNYEQVLLDLSIQLFKFYKESNLQNIKELLSALLMSPLPIFKNRGRTLLTKYLKSVAQHKNFTVLDEIIPALHTHFNLIDYKFITACICVNPIRNNEEFKMVRLCLEKAIALKDLSAKIELAQLLIDRKIDIPEAVKLITELLDQIKLSKPSEAKKLRGQCYLALGTLHSLGLEGVPKNYTTAFKYYTLANDNGNKLAPHELGYIHLLGLGREKNLEKALEFFIKSVEFNNIESRIFIAYTYLCQASKINLSPTSKLNHEENSRYINENRQYITQGVNQVKLCEFDDDVPSFVLQTAAILYLVHDLNLTLYADNTGEPATSFINELQHLNFKDTKNNHEHVNAVNDYLIQAADKENYNALYILAILYHGGNYFEENLDIAEMFYKEYSKKRGSPDLLINLYLLKSAREHNLPRRNELLVNALTLYKASLAKTVNIKSRSQLEKNWRLWINEYYHAIPKCSEPLKALYNKNILIESSTTIPESIQAIDNYLNSSESDETQLFHLLFQLKHLLKSSRHEVPQYANHLPALNKLQKKLQHAFMYFSAPMQSGVIQCLSHWPLINEKESAIEDMLLLLQLDELMWSQKVLTVLAISYFKQENAVYEDAFIRLFLNRENGVSSISNAARLLYVFATFHANTVNNPSFDLVKNSNECHVWLASLIDYIKQKLEKLETRNKKLPKIAISKIHHATNYLAHDYPKCAELSKNKLASTDSITISHQQENVYALLKGLNPSFLMEQLVEGRRVDFYNPTTGEVVLFNGPSHYLYNTEGVPVTLNTATILCQKTLERKEYTPGRNYTVIHLSYEEWMKAITKKEQIVFLKKHIPSFNSQKGNKPSLPFSGSNSSRCNKPSPKTVRRENTIKPWSSRTASSLLFKPEAPSSDPIKNPRKKEILSFK